MSTCLPESFNPTCPPLITSHFFSKCEFPDYGTVHFTRFRLSLAGSSSLVSIVISGDILMDCVCVRHPMPTPTRVAASFCERDDCSWRKTLHKTTPTSRYDIIYFRTPPTAAGNGTKVHPCTSSSLRQLDGWLGRFFDVGGVVSCRTCFFF